MADRSRATLWTLRVFTALLVAASVVVAAIGLVTRQARHAQELEDRARRAEVLLSGAGELQARHPDFDFQPETERLEAYRRLPPRERGKALAEIELLHERLLTSAVSRATGARPEDAGWEELLRWQTFSPNGFRDLYGALAFAHTRPITTAPSVTGDPLADARIAAVAAARGYRLRSDADPAALAAIGSRQLQTPALDAFRRLQARAAAEGIRLEVVSGYRSVARQRAIFQAALAGQGRLRIGREYTVREIASGNADDALHAVLAESAPPGFSRHHTGYVMDLNDPSTGRDFTEFAASPAYRWLSAVNYLNAKRSGFIPSYPPGASGQGPEPEPWEYAWVGEELLTASPAPGPAAGR
jgi:hypothetical protein